MAGIADTNTIDVVAQDADGEYVIAMVEDRPWDTDPGQPMQLREKINAYAGFILDGSLVSQYPETTRCPVRIQLDCVQQPTDDIATIIDHARGQLEKLNIGFRLNVRS
ncbi:MAG: DUF6572 domain-containing protein [Pseudonocardiaceae bacterium]